MDFVIDTSALISFFRGNDLVAETLRKILKIHEMKLTSTVAFELLVGTGADTKARNDIEGLLTTVDVIPVGLSAARRAAEIERDLTHRGLRIGVPDVLIAGVAVDRGLPVFAENVSHFMRIEGLSVWSADSWG